MLRSYTESRPRSRSLARRLALALTSIVLSLGVVSTACIWALVDIHHRLHAVKDEEVKARNIVRLASAVRDQYAHVAHTIILGNDSHEHLFREACHRLDGLVKEVRAQVVKPENVETVTRIVEASGAIEGLFDKEILPQVRAGRRDTLVETHERILELAMQAESDAETLARRAEASMEDLGRHVRATQHGAILMTIVVHLMALTTATLVGVFLYRSIARPVRALSAGAARVAAGDLESRISIERPDELGDLARKFNEMTVAIKEHQSKVLQNEKLAGLGRVAAGIAHELNNPIAVISGYAKLLRRRAEGAEVDPRVLAAIDEEAERCRQVIEGLLQLTRGGSIDRSRVELRSLVEDVVTRLRVGGLGDSFTVEISGTAMAVGDAAKLVQVMTNLIRNAAEANGPKGRVHVEISRRETEGGLVTVLVHDDGPGVRPEDRDHIFEPLFTTKPSGTGLGLAIARNIARAHGGDLVLAPASPGGATFLLSLPGDSEVSS